MLRLIACSGTRFDFRRQILADGGPVGGDTAAMNQGRTVFAQVVEFLPRRAFENAVRRYRSDRRVRALSCMDQLLRMIFAQITGRSSVRETVSCLSALGGRLYHCGIRGDIHRSTLADANEKRDYRIVMDVALAMIDAQCRQDPALGGGHRARAGVETETSWSPAL